jgi:hypothetical protein
MDGTSQDLILFLRNVLTQLPSLLTLLICLIIALVRWKRHPKVSLVAALGFISIILYPMRNGRNQSSSYASERTSGKVHHHQKA